MNIDGGGEIKQHTESARSRKAGGLIDDSEVLVGVSAVGDARSKPGSIASFFRILQGQKTNDDGRRKLVFLMSSKTTGNPSAQ